MNDQVNPAVAGPTLPEFLNARFDEDEAAAKAMRNMWDGRSPRMRREVAAKRAILRAYEPDDDDSVTLHSPDYYNLGDAALRALAAVYSDHPDYLQDWKP